MDSDEENMGSSSSSSSSGYGNSNSNSNNPNSSSSQRNARGGPSQRAMSEAEEDRLTDTQYRKIWEDAGIQMPPSEGLNRNVRKMFNYCARTYTYVKDFTWGLMNMDKSESYSVLTSHGANIFRSDLASAHPALSASRAFMSSPQGEKIATLREYTRQVQYGCAKAVIEKVTNISLEENPDENNPNDNGAGLGNVIFDMLTDNAGTAKVTRSEIMVEIIFIQVANIVLFNASSEYEGGGVSFLERQIEIMYGREALQQYKNVVTGDVTKSYVNRTWLYALLIFLDQNRINDRAREITNCPMTWFGFSALAATVFKYKDVDASRLGHAIDAALGGQVSTRINSANKVTNLQQLKMFLRDRIATGEDVRYTKEEIVHLVTDAGFPDGDRPVTINSLDESIQMMSNEIIRNERNLPTIGAEMDVASEKDTNALNRFVNESRGIAQPPVPRDTGARDSALYNGEMYDPNSPRDDSQQSLGPEFTARNDEETYYEPHVDPRWQKYKTPSLEFLERSGQLPPPPTQEFIDYQARTGYGKSTIPKGMYMKANAMQVDDFSYDKPGYNTSFGTPRSSKTSLQGLPGLRQNFLVGNKVRINDASSVYNGQTGTIVDKSSYAGAGSSGETLTIRFDSGINEQVDSKNVILVSGRGGKGRKTRKVKRSRKTKKAKKSKKSKKSRRSRK